MDSGNGIPHLKFLTGPLADRTFGANQLTQYDESNFIRIDAQNLKKTGNNMATLADNPLHGAAANGNESVQPVLGEAGVITAYTHGQFMATLSHSCQRAVIQAKLG